MKRGNERNETTLNMEDIKEYLRDTNIIDEAEELLLRNILSKPHETSGKPDGNRAGSQIRNQSFRSLSADEKRREHLDAVKISDILQECEDLLDSNKSIPGNTSKTLSNYLNREREKEVSQITTNPPRNLDQLLSSDLKSLPDIDLDELEKLATEEIFKLEQNKLSIQRRLEDQKLLLEKERQLKESEQVHKLATKGGKNNLPIVDAATSYEIQQRLLNDSKEFIDRSSKQRAEILSSQRDLAILNHLVSTSSALPKDYSYLKSILQPNQLNTDKADSVVNLMDSSTPSTTDQMKASRVQAILQDIQNEDFLQEKRREIEQLRNIEQEKEKYERLQWKDDRSTRQPHEYIIGGGERDSSNPMPLPKSLISEAGKVDRSITAENFLDKWLNEEYYLQPQTAVPSSQPLEKFPYLPSTNNSNVSSNKPNPGNASSDMRDVFDQMNILPTRQQQQQSSGDDSRAQANSEQGRYLSDRFISPSNNNNNNNNNYNSAPRNQGNSNSYYNPKYSVDTNYRHQPPHQQQQQQYPPSSYGNNPMNGFPAMMQQPQQPYYPPMMNPTAGSYPAMNQPYYPAPYPASNYPYAVNASYQGNPANGAAPRIGSDGAYALNPPSNVAVVGGSHANSNSSNAAESTATSTDPNNLYPLRRDNPTATLHRKDLLKQEEIRNLQHEIEKLKYSKELNDLQTTYQKEKLLSETELQFGLELEKQKHELQMIKMQQVIEKEKKLLELQQQQAAALKAEGGRDISDAAAGAGGRGGSKENKDQIWMNAYREESGVGVFPIPLELSKGVNVLIDGFVLPLSARQGSVYRIAVVIYDKQGKSVARLIGTPWHPWSAAPITALTEGSDGIALSAEILTKGVLCQSLKLAELLSSEVCNRIDYLLGLKVLVELQVKESESDASGGNIQPLGFAVLPLFALTAEGVTAIGGLEKLSMRPPSKPASASVRSVAEGSSGAAIAPPSGAVVIKNNAWKGVFRKGLSDPQLDAALPPKAEELSFPSSSLQPVVPQAYFLIRIVDTDQLLRASNWKLLIQGLMTIEEMQKFYQDPYLSHPLLSNHNKNTDKLSVEVTSPGSAPPSRPLSKAGGINSSLKEMFASPLDPPSSRPGSKFQNPPTLSTKSSSKPLLGTLEEVEDLEEGEGGGPTPASRSQRPVSRLLSTPLPNANGALSNNAAANNTKRNISSDHYWLQGNPLGPCTEKYQRNDGIDIYIDAARFLPDNCTISRLSLRFFTANKQMVGNTKVYSCLSQLSSPSLHPIFQLKAELRSSNLLHHSIIGLIRIDSIDCSTLTPGTVGYAVFKVFASRDRKRIQNPQDSNVYINTGAFQLPLYAGKIDPEVEAFTDDLLKDCQCVKIPCASVLVRIFPAPKASDGITTMSRDEYPPEEWMKLKLDYPLPDYRSGTYSGIACEPTPNELLAFEAKSVNNPSQSLSGETVLSQAMTANPNHSLPKKPAELSSSTSSSAAATTIGAGSKSRGRGGNTGLKSPEQVEQELQYYSSLFPAIENVRGTIDYNYTLPYHIEAGVAIRIHSLYNLPDYLLANSKLQGAAGGGGLFSGLLIGKSNTSSEISEVSYVQKVICSLSPPALYYQDPPLTDNVRWTKSMDWNRAVRHPVFQEDPYYFFPAEMSFHLYLLLEVRTIRVTTLTTATAGEEKKTQENATTTATSGSAEVVDQGKKMKLLLESEPVLTMEQYIKQKKQKKKSGGSTAEKEEAKLNTLPKSFWTLIPISCEKFLGNGYRYLSSGFYQLPLMEGAFPSITNIGGTEKTSLLKAINLYEELLQRVTISSLLPSANSDTYNNFAKLSTDGASVLVQCYHPLLQDFYTLDPASAAQQRFTDIFKNDRLRPNDTLLKLLFALIQERNPQGNKDFDEEIGLGSGGGGGGREKKKNFFPNPNFKLKLEQFRYQPERQEIVPATQTTGSATNKTYQQVLPNFLPPNQLTKEINDYFRSATGLQDY